MLVRSTRLTKQLVRSSIALGESRHLLPGVTLVARAEQRRRVQPVRGQRGRRDVVAVVVIGVVVAYFARQRAQRLMWLPCGLIVGGALGNLVDRVRVGAVTDFIKLPDWPAFNVADSVDHDRRASALVLLFGRGGASRPA